MLPSFYIENFRGFKNLTIQRLARVNLIVGKNNVGKSSFLEAVALYDAEFDKAEIYKQLKKKQEMSYLEPSLGTLFNPLFYAYNSMLFMGENSNGIKLSLSEKDVGVCLKAREKGDFISHLLQEITSRPDVPKKDVSRLREILKRKKKENNEDRWSDLDFFVKTKDYNRNIQGSIASKIPLKKKARVYVSTAGLSDSTASRLLDNLALTPHIPKLMQFLHILDSRIDYLAFSDVSITERDTQRIPFVKLKNNDAPVPLRSLGDGISRVFHIMLAMMNAKDGILLIDEFENGLHWSVQQEVWEKIFILAEKLNVQVFATTHSRDCVQAFSEVWETQSGQGAYFCLFESEEQIQVEEYDARQLLNSFKYDAETR